MPRLHASRKQPHDRLSVDRVERARGLVGEQDVAVADDGAGDRGPLALATRQLVGEPVGQLDQTDLVERRARRASRRLGADAVKLEWQGDVLDAR